MPSSRTPTERRSQRAKKRSQIGRLYDMAKTLEEIARSESQDRDEVTQAFFEVLCEFCRHELCLSMVIALQFKDDGSSHQVYSAKSDETLQLDALQRVARSKAQHLRILDHLAIYEADEPLGAPERKGYGPKSGKMILALTLDGGLWGLIVGHRPAEGPGEPADDLALGYLLSTLASVHLADLTDLGNRTNEQQLIQVNKEIKWALQRTRHLAFHDQLTGIENRRAFEEDIAARIRQDSNDGFWLLHIDLDNFKRINDTFGHQAGDEALIRVAQILTQSVPANGHAARIGGDEFTCILEGVDEDALRAFCTLFLDRIRTPVAIDKGHVQITCTIGVAWIAGQSTNPRDALHRSDVALYEAKRARKGTYAIFSDDMDQKSRERRHIERAIEKGLADEEFTPYFQPIVHTNDHSIAALEVLARWERPELPILSPAKFMPIVEEMGALAELDYLVTSKALALQQAWRSEIDTLIPMSLNISVGRLTDKSLINQIRKLGSDARFLSLELLETIYLDEPQDAVTELVHKVRNMGASIEIDDFGTGRTSILALTALRPNRIKLDKRLVIPAISSQAGRELVASVIKIAQNLNISVTAEGIETRALAQLLGELGCDRLQGYYFAHPMPEVDVIQAYRNWSSGKRGRSGPA